MQNDLVQRSIDDSENVEIPLAQLSNKAYRISIIVLTSSVARNLLAWVGAAKPRWRSAGAGDVHVNFKYKYMNTK